MLQFGSKVNFQCNLPVQRSIYSSLSTLFQYNSGIILLVMVTSTTACQTFSVTISLRATVLSLPDGPCSTQLAISVVSHVPSLSMDSVTDLTVTSNMPNLKV